MWARLDDALIDHQKISAAATFLKRNGDGRAIALGFFAVCLMWCSKHLSDGKISKEVVEGFSHVKQPLVVADALVRAGLLERVEGGFLVHDFLEYNPSAEKVKKKREEDKVRKR